MRATAWMMLPHGSGGSRPLVASKYPFRASVSARAIRVSLAVLPSPYPPLKHAKGASRRLQAGLVQAVSLGSGGDAVEAIADLLYIARLPPRHDPGADCGVATAARQRWHLAIRHFGLFGGPLAAAND